MEKGKEVVRYRPICYIIYIYLAVVITAWSHGRLKLDCLTELVLIEQDPSDVEVLCEVSFVLEDTALQCSPLRESTRLGMSCYLI